MKALFVLCVVGVIAGLVGAVHTMMEGQILSGANDSVPWGVDVAVYIFFTGMSAGSFVISSLSLFGLKKFKPIARIAVLQALVLLMIAPLFLLVAMGRPERFYLIYLSPNPTSAIAWGAYLLALYPIICLIYGYYLVRRDFGKPLAIATRERHDRLARFWGILGVPAAIMVHGYTGVLLGFILARPLWSTAMMPVLFLTSAVLSGVALLILILTVLDKWTKHKVEEGLIRTMGRLMLALLLVDAFFLLCEVLTGMYVGGSEHWESWMVLMEGGGAWSFLGVEVLLGLVVPAILLARNPKTLTPILVASGLVILGVFAMRCNLILGGQIVPAIGGEHAAYMPTVHEWLVTVGLLALGCLLYMIGARFIPLTPKPQAEDQTIDRVDVQGVPS